MGLTNFLSLSYIVGIILLMLSLGCAGDFWSLHDMEYWHVFDYGNIKFDSPQEVWNYIDQIYFEDYTKSANPRKLQEIWDSKESVDCLCRTLITLAIWYDQFGIKGEIVFSTTPTSSRSGHSYPKTKGFIYSSGTFNQNNCKEISTMKFDDIKYNIYRLK